MPSWLLPLLIKFVLPFLIKELVKSGVLSEFTAAAITDVASFVKAISELKTYHEPEDFPNPPPKVHTPNNLNR